MNKEAFLNKLKNDKIFRLNLLSLLLDDISEYIEVEKDSFGFNENIMTVRIKHDEITNDIKNTERYQENKSLFNLWIDFWSKVYTKHKTKHAESKKTFFNIMNSLSENDREFFLKKINLELDDIQSLKLPNSGSRALEKYGYNRKFYALDILLNSFDALNKIRNKDYE